LSGKHNILFFATPFEEKSADFLYKLEIPIYKIASCDVTNIPLIKHVASFGKPILVSTGGATIEDIDRVYDTIQKYHSNFAFLHCVATYPNRDEELNLLQIESLKWRYLDIVIGFSSHHSGVDPVKEAYHLGARIFEVHFTLNRGFRGTDHGFSLEPHGLAKLCEDLKRIKTRLGRRERTVLEAESTGFIRKMGKAVHVNRPIHAGKVIEPEDIVIKSPADGLPPYEDVIGKISIHDLSTADFLTWEDLK
jgi:N-acetylneuraminate synthase/sialic acid synthase